MPAGITVFGTPIGAEPWVQKQCRELVSQHRIVARALPDIDSAQSSQHIIAASLSTRINHLLRTLTPEQAEDMAAQHDHDVWTAFGHVTGHLSSAQTKEALPPLEELDAWPDIDSHWAQAAMGESPHEPILGPTASSGDWAWRQAQFSRSAGGCSLGSCFSKTRYAYVASWAMLIQTGVLEDFALMRSAFDRPAADRLPQIAALAEAWGDTWGLVEEDYLERCTGLDHPHDDHSSLHCFEAMSILPPRREATDDGEKELKLFADHLQRRLMKKFNELAFRLMLNDACSAWLQAPAGGPANKRYCRRRWNRMIAVAGKYAHAALTSLPDPPSRYERGTSDNTLNDRAVNVLTCFRLGLRPPSLGNQSAPEACPLHSLEIDLEDDLSYHFCHCGRSVQHIMHTAVARGFSRVAAEVKGLITRTEVHFIAGSGMRMDIILTNPHAEIQRKLGDVTVGTALGELKYVARGPRELKEVSEARTLAGSVAKKQEAEKKRKYGEVTAKAGAGSVVGACIEDGGGWGEGADELLEYIVQAKFGPKAEGRKYTRTNNVRARFKWLAVQHIGLQLARGVVEAHDDNLLRIRRLDPAAMRRAYTEDQLLSLACEGGSGPRDQAAHLQDPPRQDPFRPRGGGANRSDRRTPNLPLCNHEGLNQEASTPPSGTARGSTGHDGGYISGQASDGFGAGGDEEMYSQDPAG